MVTFSKEKCLTSKPQMVNLPSLSYHSADSACNIAEQTGLLPEKLKVKTKFSFS